MTNPAKSICRIEGCGNYGELKGVDKTTGYKMFRKICQFHRNKDKNIKRAKKYVYCKEKYGGDNRELKELRNE